MSFGLQSLFFWAVFLQRKTLADSLIGIATGPGAPGREGTVRVLALYAGARVGGKALRPIRRGASSALRAPGRLFGSRGGGGKPSSSTASPAPRFGTSYSAPVGGGAPSLDAPGPAERRRPADAAADPGKGKGDRPRPASASSDRMPAAGAVSAKGAGRRSPRSRQEPDRKPKGKADKDKPTPERSGERRQKQAPPRSAEPVRKVASRDSAASLGEELRAERERVDRKAPSEPPETQPPARRKSAPPPRRTPRKGGGR